MITRTQGKVGAAGLLLVLAASCGTNSVNRGTVSDATGTTAPADQKAQPDTPTWGKRYTWANGLAVEIAPPEPCKPQYAIPDKIERAVKFTFTIINGTSEAVRAGTLMIGSNAQFNGRRAEEIYDSNGECGGGFESATVLPGKTFTTAVAYAVGPEPGEMQIGLRLGITGDEAVFVGQA